MKIKLFGIIFQDDRGKNQQTLYELEISPSMRNEIISTLAVDDYSEGPLQEKMHGILPMWVFGKEVKSREIYIKVSLGISNRSAVCISFHFAQYPMNYPFKK